MTEPILILAIGNESRGDDALAPLLLRSLQEDGLNRNIELLEDFQLQIEHAADLVERELVLFVDAGMSTPAPFSFYRIRPGDGHTLFSHALTPEAVLATYVQVYKQAPPPAFVLCLRGECFELGESLSAQATSTLKSARVFMKGLLLELSPAAWDAHVVPATS
jgi:hydrogenase maturation protease